MSCSLFVCGASVRSIAQSASRLGTDIAAADLFRDLDLQQLGCRTHRVRDYPAGFERLANRIPIGEWAFTGGLENEPDLVDRISRRHRLLGTQGHVMRDIRDPWKLARVAAQHGIDFPRPTREPNATCGSAWLRKPIGGSGGINIRRIDLDPTIDAAPRGPKRANDFESPFETTSQCNHFYQPLVTGDPISAVYLVANGRVRLLGTTRQLVGCRWAGARPFQYAGSIGPLALTASIRGEVIRMGTCLAKNFDLCGLIGVDLLVSHDRIWLIEVNPRFTASVEILERGLDLQAFRAHRNACLHATLGEPSNPKARRLHGKAIVFAQRPHLVTSTFFERLPWPDRRRHRCDFADIPPNETSISPGQPVLTVFASGQSEDEVLCALKAKVCHVRESLE